MKINIYSPAYDRYLYIIGFVLSTYAVTPPFYYIFEETPFKLLFSDSLLPALIGLVFIALLFYIRPKELLLLVKGSLFIRLMPLCLFMVALESYHLVMANHNLFFIFKNFFYSNIISTFFSLILFIALTELYLYKNKEFNLLKLFVYFISFKAIIAMLIGYLMIAESFFGVSENNYIYNGSQSYESALAIVLIILFRQSIATEKTADFILIINLLPLFFFDNTASQLMLLGSVLILFLIKLFNHHAVLLKQMVSLKKLSMLAALVVILVGSNFIFNKPLSAYNIHNNHQKINTFLIKHTKKENKPRSGVVAVAPVTSAFSAISMREAVFFGLARFYELVKSNPHQKDFTIYHYQPEDNGLISRLTNKDGGLVNDSSVSITVRISGLLLPLFLPTENTLLGVGTYNAFQYIFEGYTIHSLISLFIISFGLLGLLLVLFLLAIFLMTNKPTYQSWLVALLCLYLFFMPMLFNNSFVWWQGVILLLLFKPDIFLVKDALEN